MDEPRLHIGARAPNFTAMTTLGQITLSDYRGSWLVFFSHPGGFTHACASELLAFARAAERLSALNARLLGLGIECCCAQSGHTRGICAVADLHVTFPVAADRLGEIARLYGMPRSGETDGLYGVYIIDPRQIIRDICCYPRIDEGCVEEVLFRLASLQCCEEEEPFACGDWPPCRSEFITGPLFW